MARSQRQSDGTARGGDAMHYAMGQWHVNEVDMRRQDSNERRMCQWHITEALKQPSNKAQQQRLHIKRTEAKTRAGSVKEKGVMCCCASWCASLPQ
eukprot:scaffold44757_cov20-Tisochrysis_lutea.AAC.1